MTPFETALRDLADEVRTDDVPRDLASRAWDEGRGGRGRRGRRGGHARRSRQAGRRVRRVAPPLLAAAAAAVLVLWMLLGVPGLGRDAGPADPGELPTTGYPERVRWQTDPEPLPARAGAITALVSVDDDEDWRRPGDRAINGGGIWQAITPDGRLHDLAGEVLPEPGGMGPRDFWTVTGTPALTSDGTRVAAVRLVATAEDADGSTTTDQRAVLDLHDLRTGEHHVVDDLPSAATYDAALSWDPGGTSLAVLVGDGAQTRLLTFAADGTPLATAAAADGVDGPRRSAPVLLIGWRDDDQVLLTRFGRSGWMTVIEPWAVDARTGRRDDLPRQTAMGSIKRYRGGSRPAESFFATWGDGFAMPDTGRKGRLQWFVVPDASARRDPSPEPALSWRSPIETTADPVGGTLQERDGDMVVTASVGGRAGGTETGIGRGYTNIITRGRPGGEQRLLTVVDPRLHTRELVVAAEATDRRAGTSLFGTSDASWAWYPGRTLLGVLAVLAVLGAYVWKQRRVWARQAGERADRAHRAHRADPGGPAQAG